jgi:SAM-dependent methyltransferase
VEEAATARLLRGIDAVNRRYPWSHNDHYRRWVLRQVPAGATRALDVGCGTGTLLRALARQVPVVEAVDPDPRVAALAGARVAGLLDLPAQPARVGRACGTGRVSLVSAYGTGQSGSEEELWDGSW